MAGGILGGLFGDSGDNSVMPGLLDAAGYMDPAEYDRRRRAEAMQGLWAGLLQGSGPSLEPRNFFSALGGGLAASQKSANEFDELQLRRAQGMAAFQKSALERQKLKLATDIYGEVLPKSGSTGAPPLSPGAGGTGGTGGTGGGDNLSDPRGLVPYIRAEAARLDIDPDVAVRVAGSEGLGTFLGDGGKSGGAFQLYTGGGVGNLFQRDTGLDPLDPANEKATITYALQHAAKNGWGDWNGAKKLGITGYTGIGKQREPSPPNVTDLSAVPDFTGMMMGQQGASYAPAMPGAVAAGIPPPAPAPGGTVAASRPSAQAGGYQFFGDSVAHGTREAAGAGGVTKVGWRPDQVLGSLTGANPQGDTVVISSGITNSTAADLPRDQWKQDIALVPQQIGAALKSGAGRVALYGVGDGVRDNGEINAALRQIAADNGADFVPLIGTGSYTDRQGRPHAAGWHPSDYNAQNTYTRTQLGGEGAAPAPGAIVGGRQPTVVPPVTSIPGGTNGIDPRRGAALEQILSGQQTAMAAPALRQLAQFAGPGAADSAAPEAPAPGGITYGSGVLGRAAAAAAAGAPAAAVPAAAAPAPGGTLPGAAPAPTLPAPPELPPIPAIAMPQPLPPPPAAAALRPLEATGAAPPVQLSPEQAARTQRAQRLSLALDLIGVTVPKFIADEAGIDVAARSAAAQEAAKQPFAVQMKRLEADTAAAQKRWDAQTDQQKETLAAQRGLTVKQLDAQYANIHERFKSELDLFTAGPKAEAIAAAQLPSEKAKITHQTDEQIRKDLDTPKDYKVIDPATQQERTITMTPRQAQRMGAAGPTPGLLTGLGPQATAEGTARGTELGQLNKTIDENARVARTNIADLKNMQTASQGLAMRGIFADQTQFANQLMNALTGEQAQRVASYEMVTKNSEKLVREQTRLSDNQPAAIQLVMTRNSMPTARTSEIGFDGVVSQMLGAHEYGLYVQQEKEKWLAAPEHNNSLRGFEAQLPVSPYAFMVYRMPKNLEDQLMSRLVAGGPQGQREAQMLKDQISTLRNQGYGQ